MDTASVINHPSLTRLDMAARYGEWRRARDAREAAEHAEHTALFVGLLPAALRALGIEPPGTVAVMEAYERNTERGPAVVLVPAKYAQDEETLPCVVCVHADGMTTTTDPECAEEVDQ